MGLRITLAALRLLVMRPHLYKIMEYSIVPSDANITYVHFCDWGEYRSAEPGKWTYVIFASDVRIPSV